MSVESAYDDAILGAVPQLNLFESPVIQSGVEKSMFVEYRPTNSISSQDAPISFSLGGDSANYLDLKRSRLSAKLKIVKDDGTALPKDHDKVAAPINLFLHTMFSQCELKISGKTVSVSNNAYGYKAYLQTLLTSSHAAKEHNLQTEGFYQDSWKHSTGAVEKMNLNAGILQRWNMFKEGKSVHVEGPLLEDFFQTNRFILNNTPIDIKLYRARPDFVLMNQDENVKLKLVIEDIVFKACYVKVHPGIITGHSAALQKGNAIYPYTRIEMLSYNLNTGARQFNLDNLFNGQCPTKILVSFVDSEAFAGNQQKDPLQMQLFDVSEIQVMADGVSVPGRPLTVGSSSTGNEVASAYWALYDSVGTQNTNNFDFGLELEDFANGCGIFAFPLYGAGPGDNNFLQLKRSANVRVQGNFASPLKKPVTALVYAEFPSVLEIEGSRNVIIN